MTLSPDSARRRARALAPRAAQRGNVLVIVAIAAVLIGAALFLVLSGGSGTVESLGIDDEPVATESAAGERAFELTEESGEDGARRTSASEVDVVTDATAASDAAVERRPRARIVGRVADASGLPVVGAEVVVRSAMFDGFVGFGVDGPAAGGASGARGVTDASGRFDVACAGGTQTLNVVLEGFARHERTGLEVPPAGELDVGTLTLERAIVLSGRVVDPLGRGVADAELYESTPQSSGGLVFEFGGGVAPGDEPLAVTDAGGGFSIATLPAGPWRVTVRHPEHPDAAFDGTTERPGDVERDLVWELAIGARIAGFVSGLERRAGPFRVRARKGTGLDFGGGDPSRLMADVAEDGAFELRGLDAGTDYRLVVERRADDGSLAFAAPIALASSAVSEEVVVPAGTLDARLAIAEPGRIRLRVVDGMANGEPIESYIASFGESWNLRPLADADGRAIETHPGGVAVFDDVGVALDSPFADDPIVRIEKPGYVRRDVRIDAPPAPGETLDLGDIALERAPAARITVVADGVPVPKARVRVARATDRGFELGDFGSVSRSISIDGDSGDVVSDTVGSGRPNTGRTDENGVAELDLPGRSGTYQLKVEHPRYATFSARVEVPEGTDLEHTVALGPGGTVTVRALDTVGEPVPGAAIGHRGPGTDAMGMFGGEQTDANGVLLFERLTPGTHRFRIQPDSGGQGMSFVLIDEGSSGEDWTEVTVEHGDATELVLTQQASASVAGSVRQDGAPLVGATVTLKKVREGSQDGGFSFGGPTGRTDASGRYLVESVEPGSYRLSVTHPSRAMPATFDLDVLGGIENTFDVELVRNGIRGVVLDVDGDPLAGLVVRARRESDDDAEEQFVVAFAADGAGGGGAIFGGGADTSVRTDAQGRFELAGLPEDVPIVVEVEASNAEPFTFAVHSDPYTLGVGEWIEGVELVAPPAGAIRVEVSPESMQSIMFLMVRAERLGPSGEVLDGDPITGMGRDGVCDLDGLEPGDYRVRIESLDDSGPGPTHDVTVVEGERVVVNF